MKFLISLLQFFFYSVAAAQIPDIQAFESQMKEFGLKNCNTLRDPNASFDNKLAATYYDAELVFFNIGDYTQDKSWYECAKLANSIYRDKYVLPNKGKVPGYWNFSHGLTEDAIRNNDAISKSAELLLIKNSAHALDSTSSEYTKDSAFSREVSYIIMAYLNSERLGQPKKSRLTLFVDEAFGHMNDWFGTKTAPFIRPFMVGITAHALISYNEKYPDPRTLPVLQLAADSMWNTLWLPDDKAFKYTDIDTSTLAPSTPWYNTGGMEPAPDLNLLIAPLYAWLYLQTKDSKYRDEADEIFSGGVTQANLVNGKQFNQNYRWGFKYLEWRKLGDSRNPYSKIPPPSTKDLLVLLR